MNGSGDRSVRQSRIIYGATIVAVVFFAIGTTLAMLLYPGGTYQEPTATGYDFFRNTFSELGHTIGYLDQPKLGSFLFFLVATVTAGLALLGFFLAEAREALTYGASRFIVRSVGVLGTIVGISFIAIGAIPANVAFRIHFLFVYIAFTLLAPLILLVVRAWLSLPDIPGRRLRVICYLIFLLVALSYLVLIYAGPPLYSDNGRIIQATGQKIVVYAALASVGTISIGSYRRVRALSQSRGTSAQRSASLSKK